MANSVKVVIDKAGMAEFLNTNQAIQTLLKQVGEDVASEARATASDAENGPGGTISGYASAGFKVEVHHGIKRTEVRVISNADGAIATAAHFNSQRKNGVGHLRAALYKFTKGFHKIYPVGKSYSNQKNIGA